MEKLAKTIFNPAWSIILSWTILKKRKKWTTHRKKGAARRDAARNAGPPLLRDGHVGAGRSGAAARERLGRGLARAGELWREDGGSLGFMLSRSRKLFLWIRILKQNLN